MWTLILFFVLIFVFAVPVFTLVAVSSDVAANVAGLASPGVLKMVLISLIGGFMATVIAVGIVYYGAIATYRLGLDPDPFVGVACRDINLCFSRAWCRAKGRRKRRRISPKK